MNYNTGPRSGVKAPRDQDQDLRTKTLVVSATQINPAVDLSSYNTVRQRGIQTNCDVYGWKLWFAITYRHDTTMMWRPRLPLPRTRPVVSRQRSRPPLPRPGPVFSRPRPPLLRPGTVFWRPWPRTRPPLPRPSPILPKSGLELPPEQDQDTRTTTLVRCVGR